MDFYLFFFLFVFHKEFLVISHNFNDQVYTIIIAQPNLDNQIGAIERVDINPQSLTPFPISGSGQQTNKPITPVHNPNLGYQYEISHPQTVSTLSTDTDHGGDRDNGGPIIRDNVENFQTFVTSDFFQKIPTTSQR